MRRTVARSEKREALPFAGIRPANVPGFIVAEFAGGIAATLLFRWLVPSLPASAKDVVAAHRAQE